MQEEYYKTEESVKQYIEMAEDINGSEHIDELAKFIEINNTVLELGSGPGSDWQILVKNYQVTGSDFSREFLKHLQHKFPQGLFLLLDAVTLETENRYDAIYSNKVLHHLSNVELKKSIERQYHILNSEGIICHTFWKGEGDETFKGIYVNYHTESDLYEFFETYFEIISIESYKEFEDGDSIRLIARKK